MKRQWFASIGPKSFSKDGHNATSCFTVTFALTGERDGSEVPTTRHRPRQQGYLGYCVTALSTVFSKISFTQQCSWCSPEGTKWKTSKLLGTGCSDALAPLEYNAYSEKDTSLGFGMIIAPTPWSHRTPLYFKELPDCNSVAVQIWSCIWQTFPYNKYTVFVAPDNIWPFKQNWNLRGVLRHSCGHVKTALLMWALRIQGRSSGLHKHLTCWTIAAAKAREGAMQGTCGPPTAPASPLCLV